MHCYILHDYMHHSQRTELQAEPLWHMDISIYSLRAREGVRFCTDLDRGARLCPMHALHRFMKKCMAWTYEYSIIAGKVTFEIT